MENIITVTHGNLSVRVPSDHESLGLYLLKIGFEPTIVCDTEIRQDEDRRVIISFDDSEYVNELINLLIECGDEELRNIIRRRDDTMSIDVAMDCTIHDGKEEVLLTYLFSFSHSIKSLISKALEAAIKTIDEDNAHTLDSNYSKIKVIPAIPGINTIKNGSLVKVTFVIDDMKLTSESMWISINHIDGPMIYGKLNDKPQTIRHMKAGDDVTFSILHIIQVQGFPDRFDPFKILGSSTAKTLN